MSPSKPKAEPIQVSVALDGLDGSNPLAFLAALGTLRVLSEAAKASGPRVTLHWETGRWRPVIRGAGSLLTILDTITSEIEKWRSASQAIRPPSVPDSPRTLVLTAGYLGRDESSAGSARKDPVVRDFKMPDGAFRSYLEAVRSAPLAAGFAAAFGSDAVKDQNGKTRPTALHFTSGQQRFMETVLELVTGVERPQLEEALFGPWRRASSLKTLGWDPSVSALARNYALRAKDPSERKHVSVPGADVLAFLALPLFPTAPVLRGTQIELLTTACPTRTAFRWPLWTVPATLDAVRALVRLSEWDHRAMPARGVTVVFESSIVRVAKGYGCFTPARPL